MSPLLTIAELVSRCRTHWGLEEYSPLLEHNYLLLDVASIDGRATSGELDLVAHRLRLLPCPVIAIGAVAGLATKLLGGVDVIVASIREAVTLIKNIDEHPLAALTLVQLLRHNEDVTPVQGLFAESLAYASLQGGVEFALALQAIRPPAVGADDPARVVLVERAGDELQITLNRPQARNAYSTVMRDGLYEALQLLRMDSSVARAVVSGVGSCFCIGGDLREFGATGDPATAHAVRSTRSPAQVLLAESARLEFRLHGACIGAGVELPAFAARVVACDNTFIQLPEIRLGLLPGAGGTVSIPRRIGRHRTAYLALSARRINASTALQWGLIDAII
jgi:enoyl-CoA hydratase/carnithine racemase